MNRIQQEAIASSLGLSRDRLAEITKQQAFQSMSSKEILENFGEDAYNQSLRLDAQEKFAAATEKIKGLASDLLVIFTPLVDLIADIVGPIAKAVDFVTNIGAGGTVSAINTTDGVEVIDYNKMAAAMSQAQINVSTKYDSYRAYSTTSNGGRYQSSARRESKFV